MQSLLIKTETFEFNITKFGSYFFSNGKREFFLARVVDLPWWPHFQPSGFDGGVITCCGWQLTYDNSGEPINFAPENVKAFFRGQPVQIYTYTERIAEIQSEKQAKQIALAIIGGLAAGAAAHSASRQTYTSNYSGFASGRRGITNFGGSSTTTVYNPAAGILAGAAVGGAAGLGIRQIAYDAQNQEQYANSILQANTVEPMQVVTGDLIIKTCCDPYPKPDDLVRFEVTARGKTSVFEFMRAKLTQ